MNRILGKILVILFLLLIDVIVGFFTKINYKILNTIKFTSKYSIINRIFNMIINYDKFKDILGYIVFNIIIFTMIILIIKQPSDTTDESESSDNIMNKTNSSTNQTMSNNYIN